MQKKTQQTQPSSKMSWDSLFSQQLKNISARISELRRVLKKWDQLNNSCELIPKNDQQTMTEYLKSHLKFVTETRYHEFKQNKVIHDQMIKGLQSIEEAYINFKVFDKIDSNLIISEEILLQINTLIVGQVILKQFLAKISLYLNGYIPINNVAQTQANYLTEVGQTKWGKSRYYLQNTHKNVLLLSIGIQKIPKLEYSKQQVSEMIFCQYVELIKIFRQQPSDKQLKQAISINQDLYKVSPSKNIKDEKLFPDRQAIQKLGKKVIFFNFQKKKDDSNNIIQKKVPYIFSSKLIDQDEYSEYLFNLKTYEQQKQNLFKKLQHESEITDQKKEQKLYQKQRLKKFFSFGSSKQLESIYDKIPDKLYHLTQDQKNVVAFDDNVIVIGRSGTGKTLCALLRLFIIQLFYKERQFKKINSQKRALQAKDLQKILGLKNIFLTASPYLIKQIKKQYDQMVNHIKSQLIKHKARRNKKQGNLTTQQEQIIQFDNQVLTDNTDYTDLEGFMQLFQQKIQTMKSLHDLNEADFPGFFSIKNFITMMDGTLQYPMFYKQNQQDQQDSNKKDLKTNGKTQGQKTIKGSNLSKMNQQNIGWMQQQSKQFIDNNNPEKKPQKLEQVDYISFEKLFWPQLQKSYFKFDKQIEPANVWAQIYSVIKGSYASHKSHTKYLSKIQYLKLSKRQSQQELEYKKAVYEIFEKYQCWKIGTHQYDFMDLVNHILSDIDIYGYQGPMINYLFIDEVQDLPPATLYLVSKIASNGLFYCGDSAQTIAKGVNFKFKDIPQMFHHKFALQEISLTCPRDIQLTVNFRSHNEILQLGNSIITIIHKVFPQSIDVLKQQASNFRGPIPILLTQKDEIKLLQLLTTEFTDKSKLDHQTIKNYLSNVMDNKFFKLGPEQIVLIRNQQQKDLLPYRLKQGVVLTFQQVKGLQYDDVVLVNFFSSSRLPRQKWKLLSYLHVDFKLVEKSEYQESIRCKQIIKGHHLQGDLNIPKKFNWADNKPETQMINGKQFYRVPYINYCKDINELNTKTFYQLLTELKILYTAITRARKTFIIYQQSIPKQLQQIWTKMNILRIVTSQNFQSIRSQVHQYRWIHKNKNIQNQDKAWAKQGFKWFMRKNYQQAIRCFRNNGDLKTAKKIQAIMKANQAALAIRNVSHQLKNPQNLPKFQFKIKKTMVEDKLKQIYDKFIDSAKIFQEIKNYKNAADCYYSGKSYQNALLCFKKEQNLRGCALCSQQLGKYNQAAVFYQKIQNLQKMLECYQKASNSTKISQKLFQYINEFFQSEQMCIKYGHILLNGFVKEYKLSLGQINRYGNNLNQFQGYNAVKHKQLIKKQITNNISKYILTECEENMRRIKNAKKKMQFSQNQIDKKEIQIQQLKKTLTDIVSQFGKSHPFYQFDLAQSLYQQNQAMIYNKKEEFDDICSNKQISMQNAIILIENVEKILPEYKTINKHIIQLQQQNKKLQRQIQEMQIKFGDIEDINTNIGILKKIYNQNRLQQNQIKPQINIGKINTKEIFKIQQKSIQNQIHADFMAFRGLQFQTDSLLNQSFNIQNSIQQISLDWSRSQYQNPRTNNNSVKGVIFKSYIDKNKVGSIIYKVKDIIFKMGNHLECPLKPPFPYQHHLMIDSKIQSAYTKVYRQFDDIINFLRKVERVGQQYCSLLICQFYQLYDLGKTIIISGLVKLNPIYKKSRKVINVPYVNNNVQMFSNKHIQTYINNFNEQYLQNLCFRTPSTKQRIIDSIVDSLLVQGYYRNAIQYINQKKQYIGYIFMDFKLLYQNILEQVFKFKFKFQGIYRFVNQKNFGKPAKLINCFSMQQIFYLYDSIQQRPFLSETDWKQSVKLTYQKTKQISGQVKHALRVAQTDLKNMKNDISKRRSYINNQLFQKQQTQNRQKKLKIQQILDRLHIIYEQLNQIQITKHKCSHNLDKTADQIVSFNKKIKQEENKRISGHSKISTFRKINNLMLIQETKIGLVLQSYFYEMNAQFLQYNNKQVVFLAPKFTIKWNLNNRIQQLTLQLDDVNRSKRLIQDQIAQSQKKRREYRSKLDQNQLLEQAKKQQKTTFYISREYWQSLDKVHQIEKDKYQNILNQLEKQYRFKNQNINKLQNQKRKQFTDREVNAIINYNKDKYKNQIKSRLKKTEKLPDCYQNGYFFQFLNFGQNALHQQSTRHFKNSLIKVIENVETKSFSQLDNFQQCQIIVLYLSIICYPEKSNIFDFLQDERFNEKQASKNAIRPKIAQRRRKIQDINYLRQRRQGGYYQGNQQSIIKTLNIEITNLQNQFRRIDRTQGATITTHTRLKNLLMKIYNYTNIVNDQSDLHFIELMLGFFKCRTVKQCNSLWFLERQYVIIKAGSILVKRYQGKDPNNRFCFYFDQNKQFVLMKFKNAYLTMLELLRQKHLAYLNKMKFYSQLDESKYKQKFFAKQITALGKNKKDQISKKINIFCNPDKKSQIQQNYSIFSSGKIQRTISTHKQQLLRFYYQNGFRTPQTFHFFHYQLKSLHEIYLTLEKSHHFSNIMVNDLNKKIQNLEKQFIKWKNYIRLHHQANDQNCEQQQQTDQK